MIAAFQNIHPQLHPSVFVAPSADIIGKVTVGAESSFWFQVVARGDVNTIEIGERSNIQDHSLLHVTRDTAPLKIGNDVTVGHHAVLHGCTIEDLVLIGMGAVIMDGATIPKQCLVAAGGLVPPGKTYPEKSLILGNPAKRVRALTQEELDFLPKSALNYVKDAKNYFHLNLNPA